MMNYRADVSLIYLLLSFFFVSRFFAVAVVGLVGRTISYCNIAGRTVAYEAVNLAIFL